MKKGFLLICILLVTSTLTWANANSGNERYTPRNLEESSSEAYLHALRSNQKTGIIDFNDVVAAAQQAQEMRTMRSQTTLSWHSLGPDNYGGKTKGIIYDNRDATNQTLYAGSAGGGIWKSTNEGITWVALGNNNLLVSSMVQASNGDIYIGTGDGFNAQLYTGLGNMGYTTGFMGDGIWKLTDNAGSAVFTNLIATKPQLNNNNDDWAIINELAINASGHLFAATNSGLKYSNDGGNTWANAKTSDGVELNLLSSDVQAGTDGSLAASVNNMAYISKNGNPEAFVLRSSDTDLTALPAADVTRLELAFAPSDPNIVYALLVKANGTHKGVYRSGDKGDNWMLILPETTSIALLGAKGNYNSHVTVFPNDPNRIIIGGQNLWEGIRISESGLYAWDIKSFPAGNNLSPRYVHAGQQRVAFRPGSSGIFFVATDGGIHKGTISGTEYTYSVNNRNYATAQFYTVAPSGIMNRVLGGAQDQGVIYISGQGNTQRQGETVFSRTLSGGPSALSIINTEAMIVSTTSVEIQRSEDLGFTFSAANQFLPSLGFGGSTNTAFRTPVVLWESFENQNSRDSVTFRARRAYQGGEVIKAKSNNFDHPFYHTLSPQQNLAINDTIRIKDIVSSRLFIAVTDTVFMTKEMLEFGKRPEWYQIANRNHGLTGIPHSLAVSADGNHAFVGMRDGKVYRISNLALAYNKSLGDVNSPQCIVATRLIQPTLPNSNTPISQVVTSIAIDPNNPNRVLVTLGNYGNDHYVFVTTNALDANPTWVSKQAELPKMPVYASIFEMSTSGTVFLGTEKGIYSTSDIFGTPSWVADQGLGNVTVFDLKQQLVNRAPDTVQLINVDTLVVNYPGTDNLGVIYAATFGRGLYRCNDFRKPVGIDETATIKQNQSLNIGVYPNPVIKQANIEFNLFEGGEVIYSIFDLNGRMVRNAKTGFLPQGKQQIQLNADGLKTGTYLLKLQSGKQVNAVKILVY
ncbi:MAG: T9SS type A sorting domain-containing protein [Bacteroidales bacterium]|nr:T9SS type A sorting domain-containing protein [Bacteroidales bacterium]